MQRALTTPEILVEGECIGEFTDDVAWMLLRNTQPQSFILFPGSRDAVSKLLHEWSIVPQDILSQIVAQANELAIYTAGVQTCKILLNIGRDIWAEVERKMMSCIGNLGHKIRLGEDHVRPAGID